MIRILCRYLDLVDVVFGVFVSGLLYMGAEIMVSKVQVQFSTVQSNLTYISWSL